MKLRTIHEANAVNYEMHMHKLRVCVNRENDLKARRVVSTNTIRKVDSLRTNEKILGVKACDEMFYLNACPLFNKLFIKTNSSAAFPRSSMLTPPI